MSGVEVTGFGLLRDRCLNCWFFRFFEGLVSAVDMSAQLRFGHELAATVFVRTDEFGLLFLGLFLFLTESTPRESGGSCF